MIVAAGVDVVELAGFMITALGIRPLEQEAFNFVGRIQGVAFFFVLIFGEILQHPTNVGTVRRTILIDDFAKDQNFSAAKNIGRAPIESAPIHRKTQIAFALRSKASNRRTIKSEVVPILDQEFLV